MKVNKNNETRFIPFWSINVGETFFIGANIYLKIAHKDCEPIVCPECQADIDIWEEGGYYAVNLENGEVKNVCQEDCFEPCACEVNILKGGV